MNEYVNRSLLGNKPPFYLALSPKNVKRFVIWCFKLPIGKVFRCWSKGIPLIKKKPHFRFVWPLASFCKTNSNSNTPFRGEVVLFLPSFTIDTDMFRFTILQTCSKACKQVIRSGLSSYRLYYRRRQYTFSSSLKVYILISEEAFYIWCQRGRKWVNFSAFQQNMLHA